MNVMMDTHTIEHMRYYFRRKAL